MRLGGDKRPLIAAPRLSQAVARSANVREVTDREGVACLVNVICDTTDRDGQISAAFATATELRLIAGTGPATTLTPDGVLMVIVLMALCTELGFVDEETAIQLDSSFEGAMTVVVKPTRRT